MTQTIDAPTITEKDFDALFEESDLWAVIVWNDDVNTFAHVIKALVEIFSHTKGRAEQLAWQVHQTGKAVVALRPRDEASAGVSRLQARGIQASLDRA